MKIIGITGTSGAGKDTIVEYLVTKYGYKHFSARQFLYKEIDRRKLPHDRDTLIQIADEYRKKYGPDFFIMELYKQALKYGGNSIIQSVRAKGEAEALLKKENFELWAVEVDGETRYERIKRRASETDIVDKKQFLEHEERETQKGDDSRGSILECIKLADITFDNSKDKQYLYQQIDKYMKKQNE